MNIEEIRTLDIDGINARIAQIGEEMKTDEADLDALSAEMDAIEERKNALVADAEKRINLAQRVADGEGTVIKTFESEGKNMENVDVRSSREYAAAYLKAIKGNDSEARALLSVNASAGGQIPVPTMLETEIKNAWEEHKVMSLVKHSYYAGNVKIGFELSSTGATVHTEGAEAPEEEVITFGAVELKAESIKKWITVSDEAIDGTTVDTVGYLYKEIAAKIVEKAEEILIGKITSAGTVNTAAACGVVDYSADIDVDTIVMAVSQLSAQAKNLNILMNRQTYAAFVSAGMKNKYLVDVFDGLRDRVVFTDKLVAYGSASAGNVYAIVGDFGYGAQANFPSGNEVTLKYDDMSLAEKDLVKIVGRQYVGMGVVAPFAFVRVKKA